jgi:hypothetical protein
MVNVISIYITIKVISYYGIDPAERMSAMRAQMEATRYIGGMPTLPFSLVEHITKKARWFPMNGDWFWYHMNNIYTIIIAVPAYLVCWFLDWLKREW